MTNNRLSTTHYGVRVDTKIIKCSFNAPVCDCELVLVDRARRGLLPFVSEEDVVEVIVDVQQLFGHLLVGHARN